LRPTVFVKEILEKYSIVVEQLFEVHGLPYYNSSDLTVIDD